MRTTVTLDEDVAQRVDQEVRRRGKSVKAVVNETLRAGLRMAGEAQPLPPSSVEAQDLGFRPDIDPDKLNQVSWKRSRPWPSSSDNPLAS